VTLPALIQYANLVIEEADPQSLVLFDADHDGLRYRLETDVHNTDPRRFDTDGDGLGDGYEVNDIGTNPRLADTDGDGLNDSVEVDYGFDPLVPDNQGTDTDGDGLSDAVEAVVGTDPAKKDSDGDGFSDGLELNSDHDPWVVDPKYDYFAFNPEEGSQLKLTAWLDGTMYDLANLDDGISVTAGILNRMASKALTLSSLSHLRLRTSSPLLATIGNGTATWGGSFYYPAPDGKRFVGRTFILAVPRLQSDNEMVIFAHESSNLVFWDSAGNQVLNLELEQYGFYSTTGSPLAAGTVYEVESTGDIAIMSNSRNAVAVVPAQDGNDVGTKFLFALNRYIEAAFAVFAYAPAEIDADAPVVVQVAGGNQLNDWEMVLRLIFHDADGDGLDDEEEESAGTNNSLWDTDGDGVGDGAELRFGTDPLDQGDY